MNPLGYAAVDATPVFARDGSLTMLGGDGHWWSGCSLPTRAARTVLKTLEVKGTVACFLAPPHAGYVRVALDMAAPHQAMLLVVPDVRDAAVMLRCEDFSADVAAHRLWLACGDDWAAEMARLFAEQPGLPTPTQFVRLPAAAAEVIDPLIAASQKVFADVLGRRAMEVRSLRESWRPRRGSARKVCVVVGSQFRLWDDAGIVLAEQLVQGDPHAPLSRVDWHRLDPDDPATASPLALASGAAACDALVTANFSRADAPDLLPHGMPWVTWVTTAARLPAAGAAGPNDALLVADARLRDDALRLGWPGGRVAVAAWPALTPASTSTSPAAAKALSLIAATRPLDPPKHVEEFSSHRLLWATIRDALHDDPFAPGGDAGEYLTAQLRRYEVPPEGLDRAAFIDGLIVPACVQAVARLLIREAVPLRLFGNGWAEVEEFAPYAAGAVADRAALRGIVAGSAGLVHAWPSHEAHPLDTAGRPVVRSAGRDRESFLWDVRRALAGAAAHGAEGVTTPLSASQLLRLLSAAD